MSRGCMHTSWLGPIPDFGSIGVSKAGNSDMKDAKADVIAAGWGQKREVGIKAQDFQDFLSKSELFSWLILYKLKFSFSLNAVISTSVYDIGSSLSNTSC